MDSTPARRDSTREKGRKKEERSGDVAKKSAMERKETFEGRSRLR